MVTTIDAAGRLVIPKALRDAIGLLPGAVDISVDGTGIRIEPVAGATFVDKGGRPVIAATGTPLTLDAVDDLRRGDQR